MRYSRGTLDDRCPDPSCCPHGRWSVPCLDARPDRRCQDASWSQQRQVHVTARALSKSDDRHFWGTMTRQGFGDDSPAVATLTGDVHAPATGADVGADATSGDV